MTKKPGLQSQTAEGSASDSSDFLSLIFSKAASLQMPNEREHTSFGQSCGSKEGRHRRSTRPCTGLRAGKVGSAAAPSAGWDWARSWRQAQLHTAPTEIVSEVDTKDNVKWTLRAASQGTEAVKGWA